MIYKCKKGNILEFLFFIIFFVGFNYCIFHNMDLLLDSDMSSELIVSDIMSKENSFITKSWYYSTELRIFNTQIVFAPLFKVIENYKVVRVVGVVIIDILYLLSLYTYTKELDFNHFFLLAIVFVSGFSSDCFDFLTKAPHYAFYLIANLLTCALLLNIYKDGNKKKIKVLFLLVLSLISSLNGYRQLTITYLPLFATAFLMLFFNLINKEKKVLSKKDKEFILIIFSLLLTSFVGIVLNIKVLQNLFSLGEGLAKIKLTIPTTYKIIGTLFALFSNFGYMTYLTGIAKIASLVFACVFFFAYLGGSIHILINYKNYKKQEVFLTIFCFASLAITTCIFLFTTLAVASRYYLVSALMCFSVLIITFKESKKKTINTINYLIISGIIIVIANSFLYLKYELNKSTNNELVEISNLLVEEEIYNGYSTYWNGNVLTEISNNKIDVWNFKFNDDTHINQIEDITIEKWLQKKEHIDKNPKCPFFILLNTKENNHININFSKYIKYKSDNYVLYIFENLNDFVN